MTEAQRSWWVETSSRLEFPPGSRGGFAWPLTDVGPAVMHRIVLFPTGSNWSVPTPKADNNADVLSSETVLWEPYLLLSLTKITFCSASGVCRNFVVAIVEFKRHRLLARKDRAHTITPFAAALCALHLSLISVRVQ